MRRFRGTRKSKNGTFCPGGIIRIKNLNYHSSYLLLMKDGMKPLPLRVKGASLINCVYLSGFFVS